jgi:hypothetical protein
MPLPQIPPPDEVAVFVHTQGNQQGPFSRRDLHAKLAAGEFAGSDLFWYQGMDGWIPLGDAAELFADLGGPPAQAPAPAPPPMPAEVATAAPAAAETELSPEEDDRLDGIFGELVEVSWDYFREHERASQIDEVFLGAVITGALDADYSLIDLSSDGTHHYLRFENMATHHRLVFRLRHLTGDLTTAKVLGQRASVLVGYGEKVGNVSTVINALKAEFKSGFIANPEPGTIAVDGDLTSGYVYTQVDMFWKIDDYIDADLTVDTEKIMLHISACANALRKYLRGRFA